MTLANWGARKRIWRRGIDWLSSAPFTLTCILLAIGLIAAGTLAQVRLGTFEAQQIYFNSWWLHADWGGYRVPLFPGGLTLGLLWFAALTTSFITRFRWSARDAGIYISHLGLILLLLGQFLSQTKSRESQMPLKVGESSNFSESPREMELVIINVSDPTFNVVTSIPERLLAKRKLIKPPKLPVTLEIKEFHRNAELTMAGDPAKRLANQGVGPRVAVRSLPPVSTDDERNNATALIEVREGSRSLGIWLVSAALGAPQSFVAQGQEYQITMRPHRYYYPFTLTLKEFRHDVYPGTRIPKNFSSLVQLSHPAKNEYRETLIYMNNPLRYEGRTFYQASFGENDTLSVFQVVENPAAATPYIACALVTLGLTIQFLYHLISFLRKRR